MGVHIILEGRAIFIVHFNAYLNWPFKRIAFFHDNQSINQNKEMDSRYFVYTTWNLLPVDMFNTITFAGISIEMWVIGFFFSIQVALFVWCFSCQVASVN